MSEILRSLLVRATLRSSRESASCTRCRESSPVGSATIVCRSTPSASTATPDVLPVPIVPPPPPAPPCANLRDGQQATSMKATISKAATCTSRDGPISENASRTEPWGYLNRFFGCPVPGESMRTNGTAGWRAKRSPDSHRKTHGSEGIDLPSMLIG